MPKSVRPKAREAIHDIWQANTKEHASQAFDLFIDTYADKYPKAVGCLEKDRGELMATFQPSTGAASGPPT